MIKIAPDAEDVESIIRTHGVTIISIEEESKTPFAADVQNAVIKAYKPVLERHQLRSYAYVLMHKAAVGA